MKVFKREEIDEQFKWDLSAIVNGEKEWEKIFLETQFNYKSLETFRGKLNSKDFILNCLNVEDNISLALERLYTYAKMKLDENAKVNKYQEMTARVEQLSVEISTLASFIVPELNSLDSKFLSDLAKDEDFKNYDYFLHEIIRKKQYILSDKEEKILSEVGSFSDGFHDAFNMFDNADITFAPIVNADGEEMEMSHGVYSLALQSENRRVREDGYVSMFTAFKSMINTITQLYAGNVRKDCFYARVRGYKSALEKAMSGENVGSIVYENLCKCVRKSLPILHKYIKYRAQLLGLEKLKPWDMHVGLVEGESLAIDYKDACQMVVEALAPLGNEYKDLLIRSFSERWIDVYENKGKRSGAYSWGSYNAHPYVLLNYQKTTHDIFTIAHELGHSMHSYYSNTTQPHAKAGYEIFVAEVASTVNEVLLLKHLISKANPNLRKYLLSYYMDMFRTTMFRQTQFAEFEKIAHELVEKGEALTSDGLCEVYGKLNADYYGEGLESDDFIKYEWARIPHFYRSFYVYKYATGIISAVKIVRDILTEGAPAVDRYKKFLSLGGSMSPVEILKVAGVDLTSDEPFCSVEKELSDTLEELIKATC